jgi:sRNA-binding carbon storage regulator CsrA
MNEDKAKGRVILQPKLHEVIHVGDDIQISFQRYKSGTGSRKDMVIEAPRSIKVWRTMKDRSKVE